MAYIADHGTRLRVMGAEMANRREAALRLSLEERVKALEIKIAEIVQALNAPKGEA